MTLQHKFSMSSLSRPRTGLYQWPASTSRCSEIDSSNISTGREIIFRPLPTAPTDLKVPPPCLIFQPNSVSSSDNSQSLSLAVEEIVNRVKQNGGMTSKIGFNSQRVGQLRVLHLDLLGLDIRYCPSKQCSISFAESEESLMAASLPELQSIHVMVEGADSNDDNTINVKNDTQTNDQNKSRYSVQYGQEGEHTQDAMNGLGDCWVEFKANIKRPSGFFK